MKKIALFFILASVFGAAVAQEAMKPKPTQAKTKALQTIPVKRSPTGPIGLGPLKIGMSKEALEGLSENDGIYLTAPLVVEPYSLKRSASLSAEASNQVLYESLVMTPLSKDSRRLLVSIENNKVRTISISLDDELFKMVQEQITAKYKAGNVRDTRKEEQCIYKNGSNFKKISGSYDLSWVEPISDTEEVITYIIDSVFDVCPPSLDFAMPITKSKSVFFKLRNIETGVEKKQNMF